MIKRYNSAAALALALGMSSPAVAEEPKQEPQGVSLGALITREYEGAMDAKPVTRTATGEEVPLNSEESMEKLIDQYRRSVGQRKLELAAHIQRLDEAAQQCGERIIAEGSSPTAQVLGEGADQVFAQFRTIPGYNEATDIGAEWESVVDYFTKEGTEVGGGFELFKHKDRDNRSLRVKVRVGPKVLEQILQFDAAGKLNRKDEARGGEKTAELDDLDDYDVRMVSTKDGKTALLESRSARFFGQTSAQYRVTKPWGVAGFNSFLKKGGIDATVVEGSNVRIYEGVLQGEKEAEGRIFFEIDGVFYHMEKGDTLRSLTRVAHHLELEERYAKACHKKDPNGIEHYGKKKDFKGNKYGSEADADLAKRTEALEKGNLEYVRDLAKRDKLSDTDVKEWLNSEKGKQVYVALGLFGIRKDTGKPDTFGIAREESYQARLNLTRAVNDGKVQVPEARSLLERVREERRFANDGNGLRRWYVQLSTEGKEGDLFTAGLVEVYNPEKDKWETAKNPWDPGSDAGLNASTYHLLDHRVLWGQAIVPKSPEKKDK